jgi:hypothetical protein
MKKNIICRSEVAFAETSNYASFLNQYYLHLHLHSNSARIEYAARRGLLSTTSQHALRADRDRSLVKTRQNINRYTRKRNHVLLKRTYVYVPQRYLREPMVACLWQDLQRSFVFPAVCNWNNRMCLKTGYIWHRIFLFPAN